MASEPQPGEDDGEQPPQGIEEILLESPEIRQLAAEMNEKLGAPAPVPPGFSPNGGKTHMVMLLEQLPQMLFQAVAQALQQVPAQRFKCDTCVALRIAWVTTHQAELQAANEAMAGLPPGDPRQGNPLPFLPEGTPPPPNVFDGMVMVGGSVKCADHIPGVSTQPGRKEFLIANGPLSSALIAEAMGQRAA